MATHDTSSKDTKIPTWDGDPEKFNEYKMRCIWYLESTTDKDINLVAARLVQKLTGKAWRTLEELPSDVRAQFRSPKGVEVLLDYLEAALYDKPRRRRMPMQHQTQACQKLRWR